MEINNTQIEIKRSKLKQWLILQDIQDEMLDNLKQKDYNHFVDKLCQYLEQATGQTFWKELFWIDTVLIYYQIIEINRITKKLPILQPRQIVPDKGTMPWDYAGRSWYIWANLLAKTYGWSIEYIEQMEVEDALALVEEISVDLQLDREWEWQRSEVAYGTDEQTKKVKFNALSRPDWMKEPIKIPQKTKILKSFMPVGNIIFLENPLDAESKPTNPE
jgi:hypothetical protein